MYRISIYTHSFLFSRSPDLYLDVSYEIEGSSILIHFHTTQGRLIFQIFGELLAIDFDIIHLDNTIRDVLYNRAVEPLFIKKVCFYSDNEGMRFILEKLNVSEKIVNELKEKLGGKLCELTN